MVKNKMKRALITGASSGIGLATAKLLMQSDVEVTGVARSFDSARTSGLRQCVVDLGNLPELSEALQKDEVFNSDYDFLMLNAGYGRFGGLENFSQQQIQHLINTNLISNLFLLKHFLPRFKKQGGQDIVIVGSESALQGAKQGAAYCATKFALRGLAQSLRADCSNSDIRVVLVNPGPVNSDFFDELKFRPEAGDDYSIEPSDVAKTIIQALQQPRTTVVEEINLQPMKRAFKKS